MKTAIILGGVVQNVVAGPVNPAIFPGATLVDVTNLRVSPGDLYDGTNFSPAPRPKVVSFEAFLNRFTAAEQEDLEVAGADTAGGPPANRKKQAKIRMFLRKKTGKNIDLAASDIATFVQGLETDGVIGAGRANTILNNAVQENERP